MAEEADITANHQFFTGAKKTIGFNIATDEDTADWTMVWAMRKSHTENEALVEIETSDQLVGTDSLVILTVKASDTEELEPGVYAHALKRTDTDEEHILTFGTATLMQAAAH